MGGMREILRVVEEWVADLRGSRASGQVWAEWGRRGTWWCEGFFWGDGMTAAEFIKRWSRVTQSEKAVAQSHFNELCQLLGRADAGASRPRRRGVLLRAGGGKG